MLLLDGRPLQSASALRGIGTYARGLVAGLAPLVEPGELQLLLARGASDPPELHRYGLRAPSVRVASLRRRTVQQATDPFLIANALRRIKPALYHGVEFGQPVAARMPVVITVHDLIPLVFPAQYPWERRARVLSLRLLPRADTVIAVSSSTARDIARHTRTPPSRITVVPEGVAPAFMPASPEDVDAVQRRFGVTRPYLLAVGAFDPRKRIRVLADVVRRVRPHHDVELVVAGEQGVFLPAVQEALDATGIASSTRLTGHVSMRELVALYSGARCLVFTSAYEGFGLPPLEAMACGAAAVVFANSSLVEIAGPAPAVPDGDAAAMADAVCTILDDDAGRARRSAASREWAARFTWQRTAEMTLDVYKQAIHQRLQRTSRQ